METRGNQTLKSKETSGSTSFLYRKPTVSFLLPPVRGRKLETFDQETSFEVMHDGQE